MDNKLKIIYKPTKDLKPYTNNPRLNDDAVEYVANSIKEFGFKVPMVITSDGEIVAGHTRLKACERLGITEVPCVIADDLTPEQIKAFRLADNKVGEIATWDFPKLEMEMQEIEMDMTPFGFEELGIITDAGDIKDDDFDIEPPAEPKAKNGELYRLGNHVLLCGDATKQECYERLTKGVLADLLLTDPPYNVNVEEKAGKILNDNMSDDEFYQFLFAFYSNAFSFLKEGASFYIWHADTQSLTFRKALQDAGHSQRQTIVWVKNTFTLGRQDYQWQHEPCLYGWKDGAGHHWYSDRKQSTVLEFKKPSRSEEHPTMKPLDLLGYQILNSTKHGDIVLDPFGGSGSTMMACEQLGRRCFMMELDPRFVDVIIERWEKLTNEKAELIR